MKVLARAGIKVLFLRSVFPRAMVEAYFNSLLALLVSEGCFCIYTEVDFFMETTVYVRLKALWLNLFYGGSAAINGDTYSYNLELYLLVWLSFLPDFPDFNSSFFLIPVVSRTMWVVLNSSGDLNCRPTSSFRVNGVSLLLFHKIDFRFRKSASSPGEFTLSVFKSVTSSLLSIFRSNSSLAGFSKVRFLSSLLANTGKGWLAIFSMLSSLISIASYSWS